MEGPEELERGVEPDECWGFGPVRPDAEKPDLATEVVWTSGGIQEVEIYRKLGVREVWSWQKGRLTPSMLAGEQCEAREACDALPPDAAVAAWPTERVTSRRAER